MALSCSSCNCQNRDIACYCKSCGKPLMSKATDLLNSITGMGELKGKIKEVIEINVAFRESLGSTEDRLNLHTIITGNTGTGKTMLVEILQQLYFSNGIISKPKAVCVDAPDYEEWAEDFDDNIKKAKDGILFIDNAQKLLPDGYSQEINKLDKLFSKMDMLNNNPIVILAGLPGGFMEFIEKNPRVSNRFQYQFHLKDYSAEELVGICTCRLKKRKLDVDEEILLTLKRLFKNEIKKSDATFGNGRFANTVAEDIFKTRLYDQKYKENLVLRRHITYDVPEVKSVEEALADLDDFIGMGEVKKAVKEIAQNVKYEKERANQGMKASESVAMHFVITGNPGTGKTTVARKLGEIFEAIEFLDTNYVHEVDRSKLVSEFKNTTPKLVNEACDRAMGGILFIDEAYTLAPVSSSGEADKSGKEAIETLMKRMEDDRGKFVVIVAGYQTEMDNFINANPGIKSRFNKKLHIKDYTPDELNQIYKIFTKKSGYTLHPDAEVRLEEAITQLYNNRSKEFGNGREMRQLFEETMSRLSDRVAKVPSSERTKELFSTIMVQDIPFVERKEIDPEECMKLLDGFVGIDRVKQEIREVINRLNIQLKRGDKDAAKVSDHYTFVGSPGTGKTTIARIFAKIFAQMGVLPTDHLEETDREKLVSGYTGGTAIKTKQTIDKAMGGVLFIDEAYTLKSSESDSYGQEAIDTLLKRMEDDRGKFITIAAGYTNEMEEFVNSNPGLQSRFNKKITFEDFDPEALETIFRGLVKKKGFSLTEEASETLPVFIQGIYNRRDKKNFGNAREMRRIFEKAHERQSSRLTEMLAENAQIDPEEFNIITREDIEGEVQKAQPVEELLAELDDFIGMTTVKSAVRALAKEMEVKRESIQRGMMSAENMGINIMITGNPGTGKTTITRQLSKILHSIGILSRDYVEEVDKGKLVGQFVGETPKKVNKFCDKALGGILFVDEAYTLAEGGGEHDYGKEALETIMKRMEDDKGKLVVIFAGYADKMEQLWKVNEGLQSRFDLTLHIEDYTPDELFEIFKIFAKKAKHVIAPEAEEKLKKAIVDIYDRRDGSFANAREMRNFFDRCKSAKDKRISMVDISTLANEELITITAEDIPYEEREALDAETCMQKLNELTGLDGVKTKIGSLVSQLNMEKKRGKTGRAKLTSHFVFSGNPGTGKTTVARIVVDIFKAMGVLTKGHLVETDRAGLVGTFQGETAEKTAKLIDKAMGGVLFIDEAYTLKSSENDSYGQEAIDTLLKRMEDDRGKFIVIAAGYTNEMEEFLGSNPGLPSRFNEKIVFEDYKPDALETIYRKLVEQEGFKLDSAADSFLNICIQGIYNRKTDNFGNAREMRRLFDETKQRQSIRLSELEQQGDTLEQSDYFEFTREDVEGVAKRAKPVEELLAELDDFIGMANVKSAVRALAKEMEVNQEIISRGEDSAKNMGLNIMITGNPGTGKTTVTRQLSKILHSIGILSRDYVEEVDKGKLVGQYVGETPKKVNKFCDKALGGILFVDEAYTLAEGGGSVDYGKEALETIMKRMEDDKGKMVIIFAGYADKMEKLWQVNSGLQSRFDLTLHIEDYTPDELFEIFKIFAKKAKHKLAPDAERAAKKAIAELYKKRSASFANAREMRKLFDACKSAKSKRISALDLSTLADEELRTITAADIPSQEPKIATVGSANHLAALEQLEGMDELKEALKKRANAMLISQIQAKRMGRNVINKDHFVLYNTSEDQANRISEVISSIFKSTALFSNCSVSTFDLELINKGHLGQFQLQLTQHFHQAKEGVLLLKNGDVLQQIDAIKSNAVCELIAKKLGDPATNFSLILSGKGELLTQLMEEHPALKHSFLNHFVLEKAAAVDPVICFRSLCKENGFELVEVSDELLKSYFENHSGEGDEAVGNLLNSALDKQCARLTPLIGSSEFEDCMLNEIRAEDIL